MSAPALRKRAMVIWRLAQVLAFVAVMTPTGIAEGDGQTRAAHQQAERSVRGK